VYQRLRSPCDACRGCAQSSNSTLSRIAVIAGVPVTGILGAASGSGLCKLFFIRAEVKNTYAHRFFLLMNTVNALWRHVRLLPTVAYKFW